MASCSPAAQFRKDLSTDHPHTFTERMSDGWWPSASSPGGHLGLLPELEKLPRCCTNPPVSRYASPVVFSFSFFIHRPTFDTPPLLPPWPQCQPLGLCRHEISWIIKLLFVFFTFKYTVSVPRVPPVGLLFKKFEFQRLEVCKFDLIHLSVKRVRWQVSHIFLASR